MGLHAWLVGDSTRSLLQWTSLFGPVRQPPWRTTIQFFRVPGYKYGAGRRHWLIVIPTAVGPGACAAYEAGGGRETRSGIIGNGRRPATVPLSGWRCGVVVKDLNLGRRSPRLRWPVPMLNLLPSFLAIATTSAMVFAGNDGCASNATGIAAIRPIGAKSLRGSKPELA